MTKKFTKSSIFLFTFPVCIFVLYIGYLYTLFIYLFYFVFLCRKPQIYYKKTVRNTLLIENMSILQKRFYPFIFAIPGLLQSYSDRFRRKKIKSKQHVKINTKDGGAFLVDIFDKGNEQKNVILVHGFNSSSDSSYIRNLAFHFVECNYRVFAFNSRGTKTDLLTPIFFHIGWTSDLQECVDYVLENYEGELALVGFSLGASWVAKFLGENKMANKYERVKCGMGISLPFCFFELNQYMSKWPYKISVNRLMVKKMKTYILRYASVFKDAGIDIEYVKRCTSMREIDAQVTQKIFGIQNLEEHYRKSSASAFIPLISIPFMIINANDDPVVPFNTIPIEKCKLNENIFLVLTKNGGHLGFMSYDIDKSYVEDIVIDFVGKFIQ